MEFLNLYKDQAVQQLLMRMQRAGQMSHIQAQPNICIRHGCSNYVSREERFPPGRASRALCQFCWDELMHMDANICAECGGLNPGDQVYAVVRNPREMINRLCSDECVAKWTYRCHMAAGGSPLALPQGGLQQGFIAPGTTNVPLPVQQQLSVPEPQHVPHPEPRQQVVNNYYTVNYYSDGSKDQVQPQGRGGDSEDIIEAQVIQPEPLALPEPEEQLVLNMPVYENEYDLWDIPEEPAEIPTLEPITLDELNLNRKNQP